MPFNEKVQSSQTNAVGLMQLLQQEGTASINNMTQLQHVCSLK